MPTPGFWQSGGSASANPWLPAAARSRVRVVQILAASVRQGGSAKGKTAGPLCQDVWDHGDDPRLGEDLTRIVAMVRMASRSAGVKVLLCRRPGF